MAWYFSGTASDGLFCTSTSPVSAQPITVACWFKMTATSSGGGQAKTLICFSNSTATNNNRRLRIGSAEVLAATHQTATNSREAFTANSVMINSWNHAMGWWLSDTDRRCMLNGANVATNSTSCPAGNANFFAIGRQADTVGTPIMAGQISDVAVWNVELSPIEGRWLAMGNSPLLLKHRLSNLKFYRSLQDNNFQAEVGTFDRIDLRQFGGPIGGAGPDSFRKKYTTMFFLAPFRWLMPTGATTNLTLTAAASALAQIIKGVGLNDRTTVIGIAGTTMSVGKQFSASIIGSLADVLQVGKNLSMSVTVGAAVTVSKVFMVVLNAAVSVVASVTLQVGKIASVGANVAANSVKQVGKGLTAAASSVAIIVRQIGSTVGVTVIGVAGTVMSVGKTFSATATAMPNTILQVGKTLTTAVVGAATLITSFVISIILSAAVSVAASIVSVFAAAPASPNLAKTPGHGGGLGWTPGGIRWALRRSTWRRRS